MDSERAKLLEQLESCPEGDREQLEQYVREWRMLNVRYKIYENEAQDCEKDIVALRSRSSTDRVSTMPPPSICYPQPIASRQATLCEQSHCITLWAEFTLVLIVEDRKEASEHVRKHLNGDLSDAKKRLEMVEQEMELIKAQVSRAQCENASRHTCQGIRCRSHSCQCAQHVPLQ